MFDCLTMILIGFNGKNTKHDILSCNVLEKATHLPNANRILSFLYHVLDIPCMDVSVSEPSVSFASKMKACRM